MNLTMTRAFMDSTVTLGMLRVAGIEHPPIYTLELPWRNNRQNISCIPTGIYHCNPYSSAKYVNVYQLLDVPGRSGILIHAGNTVADIQGCILPGLAAGTMKDDPAVFDSKKAMDALRFILGMDRFTLTIVQP